MERAGESMSKVDTAWLRMDSASNLMMIMGVWTLRPAIRWRELCARVQERLLRYDRFRQRVEEDGGAARWVEHDVDVTQHVVREKLPRGKGSAQARLQERIGELAMQPLDRGRPLWQMHLVENHDGGSALIFRIHHCIADGIALISVMNTMTDGGQPPPQRPELRETHEAHEGDWLSEAVLRPLTGLAVKALDLTGQGVARSVSALAHPGQPLHGGLDLARVGAQLASDAAALALMADDAPTRLKGTLSGRKRVAWGEPMPLDAVKVVGKALNCSINDVLLSCASGAIGGWLRARGDDTAGQEIRAMVPVNLRPLDQAWQLGNHFGLAPLVLPIGISNPVERVYAVHQRMARLKGSFQPLLAFGVLAATGLFAKPVQDRVLGLFAKKTTAVMTNVPGPRQPLKFCGATLRQTMFWVPASGEVGVGVSILSYGGGVQFGLITDAALCDEPQAIVDRFEPEFQQLLLLALMLPWGDEPAADTPPRARRNRAARGRASA